MKFSNFRYSVKLGAAFGATLLISLLIGLIALLNFQRLGTKADELATNWLPSVVILGDARIALSDIRRLEAQILLPTSDTERQTQIKRIGDGKARLKELNDRYRPMVTTPEEGRLLAALDTAEQAYFPATDRMVAFANQANDEGRLQGTNFLTGDSRTLYFATGKALDDLFALNQEGAKQASAAAEVARTAGQRNVLLTLAAAIVLSVLLAIWITRMVTRPLAMALDASNAMAEGRLDTVVHAEGRDETAQLLTALAGMQDRLADVVGDVRRNAEGVATASAEIAQGNQDLSSRTESQASALEETAASMEQLGSTVRQNADNAKQANQLAIKASTVAAQGGDVVHEVVQTMKEINESSRRISDIIGTIDSIAFQTNILALNAAVEAARAGEQGRGFAVVASEVRSLAQRSADAAKQIKGLIGTSVERVEQGTALVDKAGATMTEVVDAIRRVTDIMGEISAASAEQSAGVAQVGEAVTQMDQATQQNAALVEESAAAASSLRQQADLLVQSVAFFQLGGAAASMAAAVRAPAPAASVRTTTPARVATAAPRIAAIRTASAASRAPAATCLPGAAAPAPRPAAPPPAPAAGGGADDDWESF